MGRDKNLEAPCSRACIFSRADQTEALRKTKGIGRKAGSLCTMRMKV